MTRTRLVTALVALALIGAGGLAMAQQRPGPPRGGQPEGGQPDMGAMLIAGLKNTPGCLGVDAGQFQSGKNAIIAWFEDKQAAARWYHSPVHQQMMKMAFDVDDAKHERTPLEFVKDGVPIMVIASITFTDQPKLEGVALPISQIAIEIYAPQPGGAHINGRLAPKTFKVEHMRDYSETPAPGA